MIKKTKIKDLIIIDNKKYPDERGYFSELLRAKETKKNFPYVFEFFLKSIATSNILPFMTVTYFP